MDDSLDIVNLAPDSYTVGVKKSGYQDYSMAVTLQPGGKVQIHAPLQPESQAQSTANAEIASSPGGADVYVNNMYMGITPLSFQKVQPGTYTIEIRMDGYTPYSTTGQVIAGQNIQLSAALSPVPTATPTKKAAADPFVLVIALGILCIGGHFTLRR